MIAENILVQIAEHGFLVEVNAGEASLVPVEKGARMPGLLIQQVKKNKQYILDLVVCGGCQRVTTNLEDLRKLAEVNPFCDRKDCPYKPKKW